MKFTGLEHVELRLPQSLDDLRAYTSMSLLLQRPEPEIRGDGRRRRRQNNGDDGNLFVLYLGNKDVSEILLVLAVACATHVPCRVEFFTPTSAHARDVADLSLALRGRYQDVQMRVIPPWCNAHYLIIVYAESQGLLKSLIVPGSSEKIEDLSCPSNKRVGHIIHLLLFSV